MLARMEGLGLVARQRMENDQRRVAVKLTPKARRLAVRVARQAEARYQALEAAIGVDLMHQVVDALDALAAQLQPGVATALDEAGES